MQLKACESPDDIGPFRDVSLEHFKYWRSLGAPVLLVLWVASEDRLYCKWLHSYDFGPSPRGNTTRRVRFDDADSLTSRISSLRAEVEVMRLLGSGPPALPLQLSVSMEPDTRGDHQSWGDCVLILATTALRISEVGGLQVGDIDLSVVW